MKILRGNLSKFLSPFIIHHLPNFVKAYEELQKLVEGFNQAHDGKPLRIATVGAVGAGKSTLSNALRGLSNSDPRAGKTGIIECTDGVECYQSPFNALLQICDLPGYGTKKFHAEIFLADLHIHDSYNAYLFIYAGKPTEMDKNIYEKLLTMKKPVFLVRSKTDIDVDSELRTHKTLGYDVNLQNTLKTIREHAISFFAVKEKD
eukprot:gene14989-20163_t